MDRRIVTPRARPAKEPRFTAGPRLEHRFEAGRRLRPAIALLLACAFAGTIPAAADAEDVNGAASAPYSRLRDSMLHYHGPSEDQADLTEYRIGWFGPTDPHDPLTGDLWWAASLALAEANDASTNVASAPAETAPLIPFRFVPRWSTDVWGSGVSQLARMVYEEAPLALIGSVDSAATHLAEQVVAKANLPLVSPIATDKTATLAGVSWMFSCAPSDTAIARALADEILDETAGSREAGSLLLLCATDHDSRMTTRDIVAELARRGRLPDRRLDLPAGTSDVAAHLGAVRQARPQAVLVIAGVEDSARMLHAVRAVWSEVTVFGGPAMSRTRFLELAGSAADGVRVPLLWRAADLNRSDSGFVSRFTAARGHAPDYTAVLTYDATRLLFAAIRRAGPNRARIREALVALSPWEGLAGPIHFDGTGQNLRADLHLGTIRAGVLVADHPSCHPRFVSVPPCTTP